MLPETAGRSIGSGERVIVFIVFVALVEWLVPLIPSAQQAIGQIRDSVFAVERFVGQAHENLARQRRSTAISR